MPPLRSSIIGRPKKTSRNGAIGRSQGSVTAEDSVELRFVIAALRRRWWVVVLGAILGALAALVVVGGPEQGFQSTTVVAVLSPDAGSVNPDRLVAERIAVMRSTAVLEPVATRYSIGTDALRSKVDVVQQPATGLVKVVATDRDRAVARALSQAVAEEYIAFERGRSDGRRRDMLRAVDDRIGAVQAELSAASDPGTRAFKETEYGELLASRARILFESAAEATSEIVEPANEPRPVPRTRTLLLPGAGIVFGGAVGFALAATWIRLSRFVVDEASAAEMMSATYLGRLRVPPASSYRGRRRLGSWPADPFAVSVLAAQAQSMTEPGSPLRVVVVAAQRRAGATAVTLALARALSRASERVVLVDADDRNPELTAVLVRRRGRDTVAGRQDASTPPEGEDKKPGDGESGDRPVAEGNDEFWSGSEPVVLVAPRDRKPEVADVVVRQRGQEAGADPRDASTPLEGDDHTNPGDGNDGRPPDGDGSSDFWSAEVEGDGEGSIVLVGSRAGGLRRELAPAFLEKAAASGDVVVIDAGPLLASALARELCQLADAVVFVISSQKQRTDVVRYAALQLDAVSHKVLVVSASFRSRWPQFE